MCFRSKKGEWHILTSQALSKVLKQLSLREQDALDIAWLMVTKEHGHIPDEFVCDVSQQPLREAWRTNGTIPCPSTSTRLVLGQELIDFTTLFNMMGWQIGF